ncbi:hypothetical protein bpr_II052 (plasmid) [Butyrivibrio proteoclasticus B316]|uniref:Uncharacterized protein n=1 Tax=Butyrivibrio proteoclasticus (strain ATCC 51982 / DSM 14932 / B316) TaxID=515622 RepID=E0S3L0_BUTPB|nr:hypothetical protein [Butyrivibrio proteoclasticus]ADL35992.1 hypothetical protein bpr_II052 [Butyrivibrio proteoclasticus B316]
MAHRTYESPNVEITVFDTPLDNDTPAKVSGGGAAVFSAGAADGKWAMNINYTTTQVINGTEMTINVRTGNTYYVYYTLTIGDKSANGTLHCGNSNLSYVYTSSLTFMYLGT